jgi:hypothetical protein
MTRGQAVITDIDSNDYPDYCRRWTGAAFNNYDAEAKSRTGTAQVLWEDTSDILFVGFDAVFPFLGFLPEQAGNYGDFIIQYSNSGGPYSVTALHQVNQTFDIAENVPGKFTDGSYFSITGSTGNDGTWICDGDAEWTAGVTRITVTEAIPSAVVDGAMANIWTILTVLHDSTDGFAERGYLAWSIPADWGLSTIDGVSAHWVRALVESVTTPATMMHMLLSVELGEPVLFMPSDDRMRLFPDINGVVRKTDLSYTGPTKLDLELTTNAFSMANLNVFWFWWDQERKLHVEDLARTSPLTMSQDAYYIEYEGRLNKMPGEVESPYKMRVEEFILEFKIGSVVTLATTLGLS